MLEVTLGDGNSHYKFLFRACLALLNKSIMFSDWEEMIHQSKL